MWFPGGRDNSDEPQVRELTPQEQTALRLRRLTAALAVWSVLIFGRLIQIQIFHHDELRRAAQDQQERTAEIPAPRGTIFDRTGHPLAMSLPVDSVCVDPLKLKDRSMAAGILSRALDLNEAELLDKLDSAAGQKRGFLWIKRKLSPEESASLHNLAKGSKLDWIEFRTETRRFYPNGSLAAQVLGSVGSDGNGNGGVELALNGELQGHPGKMRVLTDVQHDPFETHVSVEPRPGRNITLTIDVRVQYVLERELKAAVERTHSRTGSGVVMNPRNGEILAMASYPTFDPNEPPKPGESLADRVNLAVATPFEPGSVFKVITLLSALETTNLAPETIIPCGNGRINLFGRVIHDHNSYAALSMQDVLAKSSNIGAIQIGLKVGAPALFEFIHRFGFGQRTGLPLPGESRGLLRKLTHWTKSSIGSVAMGQEVSVTTTQLARACSVVANGGLLLKPILLLNQGHDVDRGDTADPPVRVVKPETAFTMRRMMERVVLFGTGKKARLDGYTSGGKTGSAQIFDMATHTYTHHYNGSFMGFAPVVNPAVVAVITLNHTPSGEAGYGGQVAAPVFHDVVQSALRILDVPKDLPDGFKDKNEGPVDLNDLAIASLSDHPGVDPADEVVSSVTPPLVQTPGTAPADSRALDQRSFFMGDRVPDFQGKTLRAVLEQSAELGMPVSVTGSGIATAQAPPAGSTLAPGEKVLVQFARR